MFMEIIENNTGKRHYRTLKYGGSISFEVEGKRLVIRGYYDNQVKQKIDVSKYGSIQFKVVNRRA